jgi:hypothetical protein
MSEHRTVVAVDLAKTVFELAASQSPGEVARPAPGARSRHPRGSRERRAHGPTSHRGRRLGRSPGSPLDARTRVRSTAPAPSWVTRPGRSRTISSGRGRSRSTRRSRPNKVAVALANELARIVWAVWSRDDFSRSAPVEA